MTDTGNAEEGHACGAIFPQRRLQRFVDQRRSFGIDCVKLLAAALSDQCMDITRPSVRGWCRAPVRDATANAAVARVVIPNRRLVPFQILLEPMTVVALQATMSRAQRALADTRQGKYPTQCDTQAMRRMGDGNGLRE